MRAGMLVGLVDVREGCVIFESRGLDSCRM
jgi:hypothetical protein